MAHASQQCNWSQGWATTKPPLPEYLVEMQNRLKPRVAPVINLLKGKVLSCCLIINCSSFLILTQEPWKKPQLNIGSVADARPGPRTQLHNSGPIHCLWGHCHFPLSDILCVLIIGRHFLKLAGGMQILFVVAMVTTCFDYNCHTQLNCAP